MKSFLTIGGSVTLIIVGYWWATSPHLGEEAPVRPAEGAVRQTAVMAENEKLAIAKILIQQAQHSDVMGHQKTLYHPEVNPSVQTVDVDPMAPLKESAWSQSDEAEYQLKEAGYVPELVEDEVYIDVDMPKLMSLEQGDRWPVAIPQLQHEFEVNVVSAQNGDDGIQQISGLIMLEEGNFPVVLSISDDAIFGEVSTPEGDYLIEGTNQHAWLAPRRSIAANTRSDADIKDYIQQQPPKQVNANQPLPKF